MSVEIGEAAVVNHPLAGLEPTARCEARWRAIGQVLAAIAKRKSDDDGSSGRDNMFGGQDDEYKKD